MLKPCMVNHQSLCDDTLGNIQSNNLALISNGCLVTMLLQLNNDLKYACSMYREDYNLPAKYYKALIILRAPKQVVINKCLYCLLVCHRLPRIRIGDVLHAGSADNAMSLSKCPSSASVMSNINPAVAQLSLLSEILLQISQKRRLLKGKYMY